MHNSKGVMLPYELAEPIVRHFADISDVKVYPPIWSENADERHLIVSLTMIGRLPGLYLGKIEKAVDLVDQERMAELVSEGMTKEDARTRLNEVPRKDEPDWRTRIARRTGNDERKRLIDGWVQPIASYQKKLQDMADAAILPFANVTITDSHEEMNIDHLWIDRYVKERIQRLHEEPFDILRQSVHKCLTHLRSNIDDQRAWFKERDEILYRQTSLTFVGEKPVLLYRENEISEEEDLNRMSFDGETLSFYNVHDDALRVDIASHIGKTVGSIMDIGKPDIEGRKILGAGISRSVHDKPDIHLTIESDLVRLGNEEDELLRLLK